MRITSKGQVTIPKHIRDEMGLLPDTEVEFRIEDGRVVIRKVESRENHRGWKLVEHMRGRGNINMSTDEIMALTRGED